MIPNETMSRVKPGYLTFLSSVRISLGLGISLVRRVGGKSRVIVKCSSQTSEPGSIAARELAAGLAEMSSIETVAQIDAALDARVLVVSFGAEATANPGPGAL